MVSQRLHRDRINRTPVLLDTFFENEKTSMNSNVTAQMDYRLKRKSTFLVKPRFSPVEVQYLQRLVQNHIVIHYFYDLSILKAWCP